MQTYIFEGTPNFPTVILSKADGIFMIKGKSTPENAKEFYEPALEWMNQYAKSPNTETNFIFDFDFFNISSSKIILFILYKLLELQSNGHAVKVTWCYSDAYLLGAGRDYSYMVKIPFEFKKVSKKESSSKDIAA